jgi:hypothetical protein
VLKARYPITFDRWYRWLSSLLGLPPSTAYVEIDGDDVDVRMGVAFRARFKRSDVASAAPVDMRPLSRGVHGFGGKWLVNGAGRDILRIELRPDQRAHMLRIPVRLRELLVSVSDPSALANALRGEAEGYVRPVHEQIASRR